MLRINRKRAASIGAVIAAFSLVHLPAAHAETFTAGVLMEKMSGGDRYTFVAGVVEGIAYARFVADGRKAEGMGCIYRWFYETPGTVDKIFAAFERDPDRMPGPIVMALANHRCGG